MKGTATVFAAVYAAVVARQVFEDGAQVSVSWEKRRERAITEADYAVSAFRKYVNDNVE